MIYGYVRVSTKEQNEDRQIEGRLLCMGLTLENVAAGTQLPLEEVSKLAKSQID